MFLLFGTRPVRRDSKGKLPERLHCAHCGMVSDFRYQTERQYFTLFFVPVFPIGKASEIIRCTRCGGWTGPHYRDARRSSNEDHEPGKTVMECPSCSGKMRVPVKVDKSIRVTCPHCRDEFTITVSKS